MKTLKKTFKSILIVTFLLTFSTYFLENNLVEAKYVEKNKNIEIKNLLKPSDYGTTYATENTYQTRAGGTWLVKKSIKVVLNNKYKAADMIESIAGNKAKQEFLKGFHGVEPQLRQLLKWSDIPSQAVHDAVYRGMIAAGTNNYYATKIAHAIKQAVGWLL